MIAEEILAYGIQQFEEKKYDAALDAMVLAFTKGYQREWILANIYSCYMDGNEAEFRECYNTCCIYKDISYTECCLDFIPYKDSEYYIFDKMEQKFLGIVSVQEMFQAEELKREFDDVAIELDWDWRKYKESLKWAFKHKVYAICHDRKRAASFCKIPEFVDCCRKIKAFADRKAYQKYFHEDTGVVLPRFFLGEEGSRQEFVRIWEEEHAYRITAEGRNKDHILLTIGIPTFDRGFLALQKVRNLLEMTYDAEIEIVVSKNGTKLYQEDYQQIAEISDARLHYVDHNRTLTMEENFRNTIALAKGRYVLLVSDEDNVLLESLDHYLAVLARNKNLSYVRAKTKIQYSHIKDHFYKRGIEAFSGAFLAGNYLSGSIVKRESLLKLPLDEIREYAKNNAFYIHYCHDWWFSMLAFEGDFRQDAICLIAESESILDMMQEEYKKIGAENPINYGNGMLGYATYESRLEQFKGYIAFLHFIKDVGLDVIRAGVHIAIGKTGYLLRITYVICNYKPERIGDVMMQFFELCTQAVDEFPFDDVQKNELLSWAVFNIEAIVAK